MSCNMCAFAVYMLQGAVLCRKDTAQGGSVRYAYIKNQACCTCCINDFIYMRDDIYKLNNQAYKPIEKYGAAQRIYLT